LPGFFEHSWEAQIPMSVVPASLPAFLDREEQRLLDQLFELVRVPAVSAEGGPSMMKMANLVAARCDEAGLLARVEQGEGHPIVYATGGPLNAPFTLLLYGHYDVFPVSGQPGWETEPFEPVLRGDKLFARGSADSKAQFMAVLTALSWWHHHGGGLPVRVKFILDGEEEIGSPHLPDFVVRNREELDADLCVYSDGPMLPGNQPALLFGARGALVMELHSKGPAKPLHSGNFGGVVTHPVLELARLVSDLVAPNGDLTAEGINEGVPSVTPEERDALDALEIDLADFERVTGQTPLPLNFGEGYFDRLLYKPYFNVSGINSGYTGDGFRTLVPSCATAKVDVRLVGDQDPAAVLGCIERFIAERGFAGVEVRKIMSQPPSRTSLSDPYAAVVSGAVADGFGSVPKKVPSLAGTTPDWVFTKLLCVPSVLVPIGPYDQNHHGPNEYMSVRLFFCGVRTYASLIGRLAGGAEHKPSPSGAHADATTSLHREELA
jgi:acetylornithine deacetylase/succinyl-diaminopimelate desuccinylase-like protein